MSFALILIALCSIFLIIYNWRRRWMLYYASNIPGPLALPLIGSAHLFIYGLEDIYQILYKVSESFSPVCKVFVGTSLVISSSRPEDVEIIANSFLEKSSFYEYWSEYFKFPLIFAPLSTWKEHRNWLSNTFSSKVLNSFESIFVKYSKLLVNDLNKCCGKEQNDLFTIIWQRTLDTSFETLMDFEPTLMKERYEIISLIKQTERLAMQRMMHFWLHSNFLWHLSSLSKEFTKASKKLKLLGEKVVNLHISSVKKRNLESSEETFLNKKRFLNKMVELKNDEKITLEDVLDEWTLMVLGATETTAIAVNSALLILGLYPDVQEKIYQELCLNLKDNDHMTFKDINQLDYLERVIKETMRLFPVVPLIMRSLDKNIHLGEYVFPSGSNIVIPIAYMHKKPDIWPDPLKFDPDRFLPEEIKKRHRCAYIPFSFGPRNCIGLKYGMLSMKVVLADILKHFTVKAVNYRSIEEIQSEFFIIAKPKDCYNVILERRR